MPRRFRNSVGPAVRRLRIERGLTQDQLAARLALAGLENVDRVWVAKVESQIRSVFDFELAVVAAELGSKADDLLPKQKELGRDLPALHRGER
jgi:transcriptional regulator with XRE-family HTH domain